MKTKVVTQKRHERALLHARACVSEHSSFMHCVCVVCVSIFVLCVCPPFLKREAMLCANMVDLCVIVAMSSIHTFLLLLGVCVCVSGCG